MKFEINHKVTGRALFSLECGSLRLCVEAAVNAKADLTDANLRGADLTDADLRGADLRGADLRGADKLILPTGESLETYYNEVVPSLLVAGGLKLEDVATPRVWSCHSWENCPMAKAFNVHSVSDVQALHRPRAEQFVQLFDAGWIPLEKIIGKKGA